MDKGSKIRIILAAAMACVGIAFTILPVVEQQEAIARDDDLYKELALPFKHTETLETDAFASSDEIASQTALADAEKPNETPQAFSIHQTVQSASPTGYDDLLALQSQNKDFATRLVIPGTVIDYPVVRSDNADYYLHHLFSGKASKLGCLFALTTSDFETPSRNIAIYGHHLSNSEAMFSTLIAYKDEPYYAEHALIRLDTLFGSRQYRIFAVLNVRVTEWDASTASFADDRAFQNYIQRARNRAFYETGVNVPADANILTLITCDRSYGGVQGRLVVMAVEE